MLGHSFTLYKIFITLISDDADEVLHLFNCCVNNRRRIQFSLKYITFVLSIIFAKNQDLRHLLNFKLLTQLSFLSTINRANLNYTIQLLRNFYILVYECFAVIVFRVKQINYPYFLSVIKFAYVTQIKSQNIGKSKRIIS